jgi:NodT family efflux transporter outer membrane factor (OMF) lipoprotein
MLKKIKRKNYFVSAGIYFFCAMLCGCNVGPDYKRPAIQVPTKYKEATKGWKIAKPHDECPRGAWWQAFHDKQLNTLENQLNHSNQTIANAIANYDQAVALVAEARSSYFPTITAAAALNRQKQAGSGGSFTSTSILSPTGSTGSTSDAGTTGTSTATSSGVATAGNSSSNPLTSHSLFLNATWEPDIWGSARRTVEANANAAQATAALMAVTQLSTQASLAQFYFELRGVDTDQKILDDTVKADKAILKLTQNQYTAGVAGQSDVVLARTTLEQAQALAINNGVNRALYEHAIAVLVGLPPENFSIVRRYGVIKPPKIPLGFPSALLERRPDIAQAERLMAEANAQIGIAISAYYPTLTLSASGNVTNPGFAHWFSLPDLSWSLGSQLAETIFDGGLRNATVAAARAGYRANVATYRQTVLAAFQDVEDNLASLRILERQTGVQIKAAKDADLALQIVLNQYKAGIVNFSAVQQAQITALGADKSAADVQYLGMSSAVGLIKALGGGWDAVILDNAVT